MVNKHQIDSGTTISTAVICLLQIVLKCFFVCVCGNITQLGCDCDQQAVGKMKLKRERDTRRRIYYRLSTDKHFFVYEFMKVFDAFGSSVVVSHNFVRMCDRSRKR